MSPSVPTTKEIAENIQASFSAKINQNIPQVFKSFVVVLSFAFAGVIAGLYKFASYIFLQWFVETAGFDEITVNGRKIKPLVFWGRLIGVGDPSPATKAEISVEIAVENQSGSLLAGQTQIVGSLNGVTYLLQSDVLLDAPVKTGSFIAASDPDGGGGAGTIGNLSPGDSASFATPYSNVVQDVVVSALDAPGVDGETEASYRGRVVRRFAGRPQGGAGLDYVYWSEETGFVVGVYPYTGYPGEVDVYSEVESTPLNPDGIPSPTQLDAIKAAIEKDEGGLALNRPLGSFVNSLPITRRGFTVDITDLTGENLDSLKLEIEDALSLFLHEREPYVDGVTSLPKKQDIFRDDIRGIVRDYAAAANGTFTEVKIKYTDTGISFAVYTLAQGEKAKLTIVNYLTS